MSKDLSHYPKTENFEVIDTIGVPHPFTITHHHVGWAADRFMGRLGEDAIRDYEKKNGNRASCGHQVDRYNKCQLKFDEHEQALLVRCKTKDRNLTQEYLKSIVDQCEKDGYAGFTLLDGTSSKNSDVGASDSATTST